MTFTAKDVASLRQKTGAGMMECKAALTESNGNLEKASEILRQKGLVAAAKKTEKLVLEGVVAGKIQENKKAGVILELNTQTDFVAKNEKFIDLSKQLLEVILKFKPQTTEQVLSLKINNSPISEVISGNIAVIGENIQLRRFEMLDLKNEPGLVGIYIHPVGNKIGVLVKLSTNKEPASTVELEELARNLAMHIAAAQPQPEFIDRSSIPQKVIENEKRIELGKEDISKKPKEIAEKIVQGRLDKILAQKCLLEQPYIKDPNLTIDKLIKEKSKALGIDIKVSQFVRYNVGETQEKDSQQNSEKETAIIS